MVRIAFLVRSLDYGGAERQLVNLASKLADNRFQVVVICYYAGGRLQAELEEAGVPVIALGKKSRWDVLSFLRKLTVELRRFRPHIVHSYLSSSNVLSILLRPFYLTAKVVWGVRASDMTLEHYDWLTRALFRLECFLSRFADLIIVNSRAGLDYHIAKGFPTGRMAVIPNGINTEHFKPDPMGRTLMRARWHVPDECILIGVVARLDPIKDHLTFLHAAALLLRERTDIRFICIGAGAPEYSRRLKLLSEDLGLTTRMVWAGSCDNMPAAFSALDIASLSSSSEGFPNVVCEAMACEVPCVVTSVGDSELIVGATGIVVPPGDPVALAQGWIDILSEGPTSLRQRGKAARERIESEFSIEKLVQRTDQALAGLVAWQER